MPCASIAPMYKWILPLLVVIGLFVAAPARADNGTTPTSTMDDRTSESIYVVRRGDTLWGIAVDNQVTVADLIAANDLTYPSALAVVDGSFFPGPV